jgi:hypothetical protein
LLPLLILFEAARGVGIPDANGFPNYDERVLLMYTNRARADPQFEMRACGQPCGEGHCFVVKAPLGYNFNLGHAARFHSAEMSINGFFAHTSQCALVDNIASLYPASCDGSASCACKEGKLTYNATSRTDTFARIGMFGSGGGGEIIVTCSGRCGFYAWLYESSSSSVCDFSLSNGHRWLLLTANVGIGFGVHNHGMSTGDFGAASASEISKIPSGTHWTGTPAGTYEFWASWTDTQAPQKALINIDGECKLMALSRGLNPSNYAYSLNVSGLNDGSCHRYFFYFIQNNGTVWRHPSTGSLGVSSGSGCADYSTSVPGMGYGCPGGGSECTSGVCCDGYNIMANTTVCRKAASTCDIAEVCDGFNLTCPKDTSNCRKPDNAASGLFLSLSLLLFLLAAVLL